MKVKKLLKVLSDAQQLVITYYHSPDTKDGTVCTKLPYEIIKSKDILNAKVDSVTLFPAKKMMLHIECYSDKNSRSLKKKSTIGEVSPFNNSIRLL